MAAKYLLRLKNCAQVVCITRTGERFKTGSNMNSIEILENASVVVNKQGLIEDIYQVSVDGEKYKPEDFENDMDCTGKSVVPGLGQHFITLMCNSNA